MGFFKKREEEKDRLTKKPSIKKGVSKRNIIKPIAVGIGVLATIVLIAFLTKNTLIIILVAIISQIGFIAYLAKILEKEYEIKLRHLKEKEEAEHKARSLQKQLENAKIQIKYQPVQKKLIPQTANFEDMKKYIERTLRLNFKKEEIRAVLISSGWTPQQIEKAFSELGLLKQEKQYNREN